MDEESGGANQWKHGKVSGAVYRKYRSPIHNWTELKLIATSSQTEVMT